MSNRTLRAPAGQPVEAPFSDHTEVADKASCTTLGGAGTGRPLASLKMPRAAFFALLARGYWPIAIRTASATENGKKPIGKAWGAERWSPDRGVRAYQKEPNAGVGLCLGPGRAPGGAWLLDIEGDGPEAEDSRALLFGGELVETIGWESVRGGHQLVTADPERLTAIAASLAPYQIVGASPGVFHLPSLPGLELRIGGFKPDGSLKQLQSVCPPTRGTDGTPRRWNGVETLAAAPEAFYAFLERAGDARPVEVKAPAPAATPPAAAGSKRPDALTRARLYLQACQPAVSTKKGHNQTFKVACKVGPGFNLDYEVAVRLIMDEYNPRCQPPWDEPDVRHKLTDAYDKEAHRLGWKLEEDRWAHRNGNGAGNGRIAPPPAPPPPSELRTAAGDKRPIIVISTEEHEVIDSAVAALAVEPNVYQRGNALVTILRDPTRIKSGKFDRPKGSPRIASLPLPRLRELMTKTAEWQTEHVNRNGDVKAVPAHPPDWAIKGVDARGEWREIRPLEAIVETPLLRPDGTILEVPGWDEETELLFEPNIAFPPIPPKPDREDARYAAEFLMELVVDFPFASENHKAAWLAALLTPMARFAIDGPCPLFLFNANTAGIGKTVLADIISIVCTGRKMPKTTYPDNEEEMRKRVTATALAADRMMLLDNVAVTFGGSAIDSVITATSWNDRMLGASRMTGELRLFTVWFATGNNVTLRGDMVRRVQPCRLETHFERPEERTGFVIQGDLSNHVRRHRRELVVAALTMLRAHALAGRPTEGLNPLGSFESWCEVVRSAVVWAIGVDPLKTRDELRAHDPETIARAALVEAWSEVPGTQSGMTIADVLRLIKADRDRYQKLVDVLMEWSRNDDLPSTKTIGQRLNFMRGKVFNGRCFQSTEVQGTQVWKIVSV